MDNRVLIIKDYVKYYADEINKYYPKMLSDKEIEELSDKYSSMHGNIGDISLAFSREMFERINIYSTSKEIDKTNNIMETKKNDEINIKSFSETYRENMTNLFKIYHDIVNNPSLDEAGKKQKFEEEERKYLLENHRYTVSEIEKQITQRYMMDTNSVERQKLLDSKVQPFDYDTMKLLYSHYIRDFNYIDNNLKEKKIDLTEKTTSKTSDRIGLETLKEILEYKKNNKDTNLNIHYYALIWKNTISDRTIQEIKNVDLSGGSEEEKFNRKKDIAVRSVSAFIKEFFEWSSKNGYVVNPEEIYREIYNSNDTNELITIHVPSGDITLRDGNENSKMLHDLFVAPRKEVKQEKKEEVIEDKKETLEPPLKSEEQMQKDETLGANELDDEAKREDALKGNINLEDAKLKSSLNVAKNVGGFALGAAGIASLLDETREENPIIDNSNFKDNSDDLRKEDFIKQALLEQAPIKETPAEMVPEKAEMQESPEDYAGKLLNISDSVEEKSTSNSEIKPITTDAMLQDRESEDSKVLQAFTPEENKLAAAMREENQKLMKKNKPMVRTMGVQKPKYKLNAGAANALIIAFLVGMIVGISLILFASLMGNI